MAKGYSKIGVGGGGSGKVGTDNSINAAINNAMNGGIPVSFEEMSDIVSSNYGLNAGKLSSSDRLKLAGIFPDKASDIRSGNVFQANLDNLSIDELISVVRLSKKIGTYASTFCLEDALKLISYQQNNALPFGQRG